MKLTSKKSVIWIFLQLLDYVCKLNTFGYFRRWLLSSNIRKIHFTVLTPLFWLRGRTRNLEDLTFLVKSQYFVCFKSQIFVKNLLLWLSVQVCYRNVQKSSYDLFSESVWFVVWRQLTAIVARREGPQNWEGERLQSHCLGWTFVDKTGPPMG